jgi:undecaprenyl diphosphate synthase
MSTDEVELRNSMPRHVAIIMDGNGRWAKSKKLPRALGHQAGVKTVRKIVDYCASNYIEVLTLFAFSSENWRRPQEEVSILMGLFMSTLQREVKNLQKNNICLRFIGDRSAFSQKLQDKIASAELQTRNNTGLILVVAANYGGRWDIVQASKKMLAAILAGEIKPEDVNEATVSRYLSIADLPEPDLFIRTSGEARISNFLLWQLAYTELYFTAEFWPDFNEQSMQQAVEYFKSRQRRFGHTGEQLQDKTAVI